ncbi:MAG: hypothetical protein U5K74_14545 [Gemmatimonadaceae bacterium]|nr:hypothetical protein [Gemmatimonadaceae bacterium]
MNALSTTDDQSVTSDQTAELMTVCAISQYSTSPVTPDRSTAGDRSTSGHVPISTVDETIVALRGLSSSAAPTMMAGAASIDTDGNVLAEISDRLDSNTTAPMHVTPPTNSLFRYARPAPIRQVSAAPINT